MGQKVNPIVLRLSVNKDWSSKWYAKGREFADLLHEDLKIRKYRDAKYDLGICISICQENMELLYKAIHKPLFKSVFLRCIANLILNDEAYYNDWVYIQKSQSYSHLFFIRGLNYSLKNQTQKALEEYEKVLKISPNFFKDNDYLIVHIPEELKAIFNLYSL